MYPHSFLKLLKKKIFKNILFHIIVGIYMQKWSRKIQLKNKKNKQYTQEFIAMKTKIFPPYQFKVSTKKKKKKKQNKKICI